MKAVRSLSVTSSARACQCSGWPRSHSCSGSLGICSSVQGSAATASWLRTLPSNTEISPNHCGGSRRVSSAERASSDRPPVPDTVSAPRSTAYSPQGGSPRKNRDWPTVSCRMRPMRSSAAANSGGNWANQRPDWSAMRWAETSVVMQSEIRVGRAKGQARQESAPGGDAQAAQTCRGPGSSNACGAVCMAAWVRVEKGRDRAG